MLGQLTGEHQTDGGLDLAGRDGVALVVASQTSTLGGNALEQVVHKGVHDDHGLLGNTSVRVHLLEHLVDVRGVRVGVGLALAGLLVVSALSLGRGLASLAGCLSRCCLCLKNKTFFSEFFLFLFRAPKKFSFDLRGKSHSKCKETKDRKKERTFLPSNTKTKLRAKKKKKRKEKKRKEWKRREKKEQMRQGF